MISFFGVTFLKPILKSSLGKLSHKNVPMIKVGKGLSFGDVWNGLKITIRSFEGDKNLGIDKIRKTFIAQVLVLLKPGFDELNLRKIGEEDRHVFWQGLKWIFVQINIICF
jgi:hypothetical protein